MSQSINIPGILYFPYVRFISKKMVLPHFWVPNINHMNPYSMEWHGFEGVVFDKDNTLTIPYRNTLFSLIGKTFDQFKEVFKDRVVIMSNKAGTRDDKGYADAAAIEEKFGVPVIRHRCKKPWGGKDITDHFTKVLGHECDPRNLVMIGDNPLTDIVLGNRYGMLTVMTEPLFEEGDNGLQSVIKGYMKRKMVKWRRKCLWAPPHPKYDYLLSNGGILH